MKNPFVTIHPAGKDFIAQLTASESFYESKICEAGASIETNPPQTVFILDRSGSMGQNVHRMARLVIPALARKYFNLQDSDKLIVITFDCSIETRIASVSEMERTELQARGSTRMAGVFRALQNALDASNPNVRIVAISDGIIHDPDQTLTQADQVSSTLKENFSISATAVRLFTSASQPDTRALASILQLNTDHAGSIIDLQAPTGGNKDIEYAVETIGKALGSGGWPTLSLQANTPCLLSAPWDSPRGLIHFRASKTALTFWLKFLPDEITLNDVPLTIHKGDPVSHDTLHVLLADKIDYYMRHLRVLKVFDSPAAKLEISQIVGYFKDLEESMHPPAELVPLLKDGSLAGRMQYFKSSLSRHLKSLSVQMETIANNERIASLNLAQQASYLRQNNASTNSRTTRGLARRADASGLNFEDVMRAEIMAMSTNIAELADVDDSDHAVSFYCQATTMEGIRHLADLARTHPEILNNLTAAQLLRLFNVVGIPAVGPIGDFPDPMSYRLSKLLYGCYVSVADITVVLDQNGKLLHPGSNKEEEIVTSVPFFEDRRVQKFLQRYARSSLEYITSIGMRRMIAEVPKTYPYTICAGIWKMIEELNQEKTEIRIQLFSQMVHTYDNAIAGFFDHILPLLLENQDPSKSYYLGHNGITNLIGPILHLVRNKKTQHMARILRALYSFETYQAMRRLVRTDGGDPLAVRQVALDKLLGIDLSTSPHRTPLPELFSRPNVEATHYCEAHVEHEELGKYKQSLWFVSYVTLLEPLFSGLIHSKDVVTALKAVPTMSKSTISSTLELTSISLDDFMLYNVVEGLLNGDKASRIDKETEKPKLSDLGNPGVGSTMIKQYVQSRYKADYETRLKRQLAQEQKILLGELIVDLLETDDLTEFITLLQEGKTRGQVKVSMDRDNCPGFPQLHKCLLNEDLNLIKQSGAAGVRKCVAKLFVIYSGVCPTTRKAVFNGGSLLLSANWKPLKAVLLSKGPTAKATWYQLEKELSTRGHRYRSTGCNRHGHSNEFPSFFAYGCRSLADYHALVGDGSVWCAYIEKHRNCCGVQEYLAMQQAAAFITR